MSVSPDALLKLNTDIGARQVANKAGATPRAQSESASFAALYAQQRQPQQPAPAAPEPRHTAPENKPAERQEPVARAKPAERRESAPKERPQRSEDDSPDAGAASVNDGEETPAVAESGKALPADGEATDDDVAADPLLLLGLSGEGPLTPEPVAAETLAASVSIPAAVDSEAPPEDAPVDDLLAGLRKSVSLELKDPTDVGATDPAAATDPKMQASAKASDGFASTLVALDGKQTETAEANPDVALFDQALQAGEGAKDSKPASAGDALGVRLNTLAQAIGQAQQVQRAQPQVPGQPVQMQQNGWSEQIADRVMWLSSQNLKSAEIQLDPQELGRLEVRIEMNKDQTQVTFLSPHAGVREALESQSHRLRDMFTQQGMNLADVNVGDQSLARGSQGQGQDGRGQGRGSFAGGDEAIADERVIGTSEVSANRTLGDRGLVDYFA